MACPVTIALPQAIAAAAHPGKPCLVNPQGKVFDRTGKDARSAETSEIRGKAWMQGN
jgi:hypothetical protein